MAQAQINPIAVTREGERWLAHFRWSYETKELVKRAGWTFSPTEKLWYTRDPLVAARIDPRAMLEAHEHRSPAGRNPSEPANQYLPGTVSAVLDKAEERYPGHYYKAAPGSFRRGDVLTEVPTDVPF